MKRVAILAMMLIGFWSASCSGSDGSEMPEGPSTEQPGNENENNDEDMETRTMKIKVGATTFTVDLVDNSSVRALVEMLSSSDIEIDMRDYAGMEKVGYLSRSLPQNNSNISTSAGDVILYQGNQFVIYYGTNQWSLTRLGKIRNATRETLLSALGKGDVTVTLSIE